MAHRQSVEFLSNLGIIGLYAMRHALCSMHYNIQHRTQFSGRKSGTLQGLSYGFVYLVGGVKITFKNLVSGW